MSLKHHEFIKGRGAQIQTGNKFLKHEYVTEHDEGLDEMWELDAKTVYLIEHPKKMVNKVESPDIPVMYSMNPYQGCEHGCIYCYARNTHEYYGYNAGLDFESNIIVKPNAPAILKKQLDAKSWDPDVIMLAGNTDCYQPAEKKFQITRKLLEVLLEYKNPVGIITKNALIQRDVDILSEMAKRNLVCVNFSVTSLKEETRLLLEPRTATGKKRLQAMEFLAKHGIPVRVMAAPMIPFINSDELPEILKAASEHGALDAGYTVVRLNGKIGEVFENWIRQALPDKADRVLAQIKAAHGGNLNDSRFGTRMRGEGKFVESLHTMFRIAKNKFFDGKELPGLDASQFRRPGNGQLDLFQ
jgi:DNA repair photolyase